MYKLRARPRVLIADPDVSHGNQLSGYLWDHGFEARVCASVHEAKHSAEDWRPETLFADFLLPDTNVLDLLDYIKVLNLSVPPQIIVTSDQRPWKAMEQARASGADGFLMKPFSNAQALRAIWPASKEKPTSGGRLEDPFILRELHFMSLLLNEAKRELYSEAGLFNLMRLINSSLKGVRTSLIQCLNADCGLVLASHDDLQVHGLRISLCDYPEIQKVRETLQPMLIPDVQSAEIFADHAPRLKRMPFKAMAIFPVFRQGDFLGVMSVRLERHHPRQMLYVESLGVVCSQIISLVI